ncbi:MAG TPA: hypothetical protein VH083_27330 [Myxococcales bacterium]|nr:hypothetical protein [Myxococcales bacterium]
MYSRPIDPGLQVSGASVSAILKGFGGFSLLASRVLYDVGVGELDDAGIIQLDETVWYPASSFLRACARIERELGASVVYQAGQALAQYVPLPERRDDIEGALRSIDVGYYLNHAMHGEPLFDVATGKMRGAIGHYAVARVSGRQLVATCDNPYPCDLARGIIEATARRSQPTTTVVHDTKVRCRKRGGDACHFIVQW